MESGKARTIHADKERLPAMNANKSCMPAFEKSVSSDLPCKPGSKACRSFI